MRTKRAALYAPIQPKTSRRSKCKFLRCGATVRHRGWDLALEIQEVGSGADRDRVKRAELLAAARKKQVDVVVVWKLDRWGRSLLDLIHTLQELEVLGTGFVSITEALDLTTPTGRAMAGMLGVFAEFEREMLRERIKAGIKQAKKDGKHCGRPPSALLKTKEVLTLYRKKTSLRQIAKDLGMSRSSARRILCLEGVLQEKR